MPGRLSSWKRSYLLGAIGVALFALTAPRSLFALPLDPQPTTEAAVAFVDRLELGSGTAFCIRPEGWFLTAAHVVEGIELGGAVRIVTDSGVPGVEKIWQATLVHRSQDGDLALLRTEPRGDGQTFAALPLAASDKEIALRAPVEVLGFPFGKYIDFQPFPAISVSEGKVTSLRRNPRGLALVQFDVNVNPGHSGGPLLSAKGDVIGLVTHRVAAGNAISFATPVGRIHEFLATPGIALVDPQVRWDDRLKPQRIAVRLFTEHLPARPDRIDLKLRYPATRERVLSINLTPDAREAVFETPLYPTPTRPLGLVLQRGFNHHRGWGHELRIDNGPLLADPQIELVDVARILRPGDRYEFSTRDGEKLPLPLDKCMLPAQKLKEVLPAQGWQSTVVHVADPAAGVIEYGLQLFVKDRAIASEQGDIVLRQRPLFVDQIGDPPTFDQPLSHLHLIVAVEGVAEIRLAEATETQRGGLRIDYTRGKAPGEWSRLGPFVWVQNQMWHPFGSAVKDDLPVLTAKSVLTRVESSWLELPLVAGETEVKVARWHSPVTNGPLGANEMRQIALGNLKSIVLESPGGKRAVYSIEVRPKP